MLTKCGGLELAADRIRVNSVAPGLVDTPMTAFQRDIPAIRRAYLDAIPLNRVGRVGDIASAALFLASDDADWITGVELTADGGQTLTGYPDLVKLFAEAGGVNYDAHLES
jgi:NAD(P)-dependent dehydrogenase (short-subunit alcohol dehydrogenase family)